MANIGLGDLTEEDSREGHLVEESLGLEDLGCEGDIGEGERRMEEVGEEDSSMGHSGEGDLTSGGGSSMDDFVRFGL